MPSSLAYVERASAVGPRRPRAPRAAPHAPRAGPLRHSGPVRASTVAHAVPMYGDLATTPTRKLLSILFSDSSPLQLHVHLTPQTPLRLRPPTRHTLGRSAAAKRHANRRCQSQIARIGIGHAHGIGVARIGVGGGDHGMLSMPLSTSHARTTLHGSTHHGGGGGRRPSGARRGVLAETAWRVGAAGWAAEGTSSLYWPL